jgi:hypothetical protein
LAEDFLQSWLKIKITLFQIYFSASKVTGMLWMILDYFLEALDNGSLVGTRALRSLKKRIDKFFYGQETLSKRTLER